MKEENKLGGKDLAIIILVACLTSLSIAYATISATLTISNNLTVKAQNWDIHFENLEQENITGDNSTRIVKSATIEEDTTKISGLEVEFKKPGDKVVYTFDVKNAGDIDARLTDISIDVPTCTPASSICNDIEYKITYENGQEIKISDSLDKGKSVKLKLTINYKSSSTVLVTQDIIVDGIDAVFVYTQK